MAIIAFPFDTEDTTEAQYSLLFSNLQDDGFVGVPGNDQGKVNASTGMDVVSQPIDFAMLAGFVATDTEEETLTLDAADTSPRIDRIVLHVDPQTDTCTRTILKGTAQSSPVAPDLTNDVGGVWEIPIARIAIAANASNVIASDITDERLFISTRLGVWTTSTRSKYEVTGQAGFNYTTQVLEFYTGTKWIALSDSVTAAQISDSSVLGRSLVRAGNISAAQQAIGIFVQDSNPGTKPAGSVWIQRA